MNDATLAKLEFDEIRQILASHCSCGLGKKLALSLRPTTNTGLVRTWLDQVRGMLDVVDGFGLPPMGGMHDIRNEVQACGFPSPLEPEQLAMIAETLVATSSLKAWLAQVSGMSAELASIDSRVKSFSALGSKISDSIDSRGHVRDYASRRLGAIRGTITSSREQIRSCFDRLLKQPHTTKMLQYAGSTFHNDRMVLPLKAEYRGRIRGIIHRSSDTGSTLFIEPDESVQLNNNIVRLKEEESKEITRILTELCSLVFQEAEDILSSLRAIGILDLVAAKCKYAKARDCYCPDIDENGVMDLHDARHPLLIEVFANEAKEGGPVREVVPIDFRIGEDFDILAITGPNTGGKTVALKTIGMLALMTQSGIPIPTAECSRMPIFKKIFVDVGDEQSIQQSLSTFSSHLSNLLSIIQQCGEGSLVLIDELGAGTDPDEGAAIGQAIVHELLRLKAKGVVTTHLSSLKAMAYSTDRVDNGCVEFDPQSLRPTFRLRLGEPGNSNALIIAERLGMSTRMVTLAKRFLDNRHRILHDAIKGTLDSRREAEHARKAARKAKLEAQKASEELSARQQKLQERQAAFDEWTEWVNKLQPGDEVYVTSLRDSAKIVRMRLHQQKAIVAARSMDLEVPLRDIDRPRDE